MGFFKIFTFLISNREEIIYNEEEDDEYDEGDMQFDTETTFISNGGLDGGEVISEPNYVKE